MIQFRHHLSILLDDRQRRRMILVLVGILAGAVLEMAAIASVPAFIVLLNSPDRIAGLVSEDGMLSSWIRSAAPSDIAFISSCLLAGLFLFKNAFISAMTYAEASVQRDITTSVTSKLFKAYLFTPYTFHLERNPAQLIRNISFEAGEAIKLIQSEVSIVRESMVLAVVFLLLLVADPLVSLSIFTLVGLAAAAFSVSVRRTMTRRGQLVQLHRGRQIQIVNQGLGAIKDAKILGREPFLARLFEAETRDKEHHELFQRVVQVLPRLVLEVAGVVALVAVAAMFVILERPPQDMLPVLVLLAVAVVRLVPAFNVITASVNNIRYTRASFNLVCRELETLKADDAAEAHGPLGTGDRWRLRNEIVLQDVHYAYPNAAEAALNGISLRIGRGEAVALIGESGAGKSTLVDVILGLLEPTAGTVMVDGRDIRTNLAGWQRQIGYVPQDIYLLDDAIRRNIAFGVPDDEIDHRALERALAVAQLEELIVALPQGLDTVSGNRGIRLSGGQRQRIGIARALYHQPTVLVMDEATSSLDNETERAVVEAIGRLRGHHTVIMIAHRLTTVMSCDTLYLIEKGRVGDAGNYLELAQRHKHLRLPSGESACARKAG